MRVSARELTDGNLDGTFETLDKTTEYLNDPANHTGYSQVIRESHFDDEAVLTKTIDYSFGHDELSQTTREYNALGQITSELTHLFGHDGHASVRMLTDLTATVAQFYQYDAYGQLLGIWNGSGTLLSGGADGELANASLALTSTLYSGEQFDARIGQQYLRARYYDPATGRFNRLDPFFGNQTDPQSFHKYLYTHADPVNGIDPTGEFGIALAMGIAFSIAFAILAAPNTANAPAPGDAVIPDQGDDIVGALATELFVAAGGHIVFKYAVNPITGGLYSKLFSKPAQEAAGETLTSGGRTVVRKVRQELTNPLGGRLKGDNLARPGAVNDIMVIGKLGDTAPSIGLPNHNILKLDGGWTIHVNDGWVMRGIM